MFALMVFWRVWPNNFISSDVGIYFKYITKCGTLNITYDPDIISIEGNIAPILVARSSIIRLLIIPIYIATL